jgi:glycosyltransferase involved in cell wall biosynthesis
MGSCRLDLVTDLSPESAELRQYAVKEGADVEFHSRVSHEELTKIYQGHQIYLKTSRFEGHPKTSLEAMACGCAVNGTQAPGIEELIEKNVTGLLVAPTALAIHQAIVSLMADEKYRKNLVQMRLNTLSNIALWIAQLEMKSRLILIVRWCQICPRSDELRASETGMRTRIEIIIVNDRNLATQ